MIKDWGEVEAEKAMTLVLDGYLYIHDTTKMLMPYCFAFDTSWLMCEGRPFGSLRSKPPKRLDSFISQCIETLMDLCQQFAGAIAFPNMIVNSAFFTKDLTDYQIKNEFQKFIHSSNNEFRVGGDSPFSNISIFCRESILRTFEKAMYPDGSLVVDNISEIMRCQEIFMDLISKGDPISGGNYKFPVTTINLYAKEGDIKDVGFLKKLAKYNSRSGAFNIHVGEKLASCCRLTQDLKDLKGVDSFGNGGLSLGSHRVVTLNLYGIKKDNIDLEGCVSSSRKILISHKNLMRKMKETGIFKFFNLNWVTMEMFFSTIGYVGLWDSWQLSNPKLDYEEYSKTLLQSIDLRPADSCVFNLEEVPAEGASITLAKKFHHPEGILSNQFLPLYKEYCLDDRICITGKLMKYATGGAILHLNVNDKMNEGSCEELIKYCVENGVTHFAINNGRSYCENGHSELGIVYECTTCGGKMVDWEMRIVGYNTKVSSWSSRRREEFFKREKYDLMTVESVTSNDEYIKLSSRAFYNWFKIINK
jgi:ribonucleoside-triphosphate reductase